jgi:hypothetical protein
MPETNRTSSRWTSGALLLIAALMLLAGQTFLASILTGWFFVIYWLVCLLVTGAAGISGVLEISALRRRWAQEQREFLNETLHQVEEIQREKQRRFPGDSGTA